MVNIPRFWRAQDELSVCLTCASRAALLLSRAVSARALEMMALEENHVRPIQSMPFLSSMKKAEKPTAFYTIQTQFQTDNTGNNCGYKPLVNASNFGHCFLLRR